MAIINSLAIGKSVKSAGNLTYKTVRGRTIASQRITQNKSNTLFQSLQRGHFSTVSKCITLCQSWIDKAFEPSKYGSARNNFFKLNKDFTLSNFYGNVIGGTMSLAKAFVSCFANYSETTKKQLNYIAYGSAPCLMSETLSTLATVTIDSSEFKNVRSCSFLSVDFPSGISFDKLTFLFFGFSKNEPNMITVGKIVLAKNVSGKVEFDWGNSDSKAAGVFEASSTISDTDGVVSSVIFSPDYSGNDVYACWVVPFFNGKLSRVTVPFVAHQ